MRNKNSKLTTKREVEVAKATLNRIDKIARNAQTVSEIRFAMFLMHEELKCTEDFIEVQEIKREIDYFNSKVEYCMNCRWSPCHLCHHLFNGCYEPTPEIVEEIKARWQTNL